MHALAECWLVEPSILLALHHDPGQRHPVVVQPVVGRALEPHGVTHGNGGVEAWNSVRFYLQRHRLRHYEWPFANEVKSKNGYSGINSGKVCIQNR